MYATTSVQLMLLDLPSPIDLYYVAFPRDSTWVKIVVYVVYTLEALQTLMICRTAFHAFVYGFFSLDSLDVIGSLWFSIPVLGALGASIYKSCCPSRPVTLMTMLIAIVSFIVQSFYAYRIFCLGHMLGGKTQRIITIAITIVNYLHFCARCGICTDCL